MTKKQMLKIMDERGWIHDLTMDDTYESIKEEFEEMKSELDDDSDMFPNGRDYEAEDEDGPF